MVNFERFFTICRIFFTFETILISSDEEQDEFDNMNGKKLDMSKSPIYSYANAVNATVLLGNDLNLSSDGDSSRNDDES